MILSMNKIKLSFFISLGIVLLGAIIFFVGVSFHNFSCMWAGLIIFLIGGVFLLILLFYKAYLSRKEIDKNNIKRK